MRQDLEDAARIDRLERHVERLRAERTSRFGERLLLVGLVLALPAVASAVDVTHSFESGGRIYAQDLNDNFADLSVAVTDLQAGQAGPRTLGADVDGWTGSALSASEPNAVIDGLGVEIETHGRPVRIEIIGNGEQQPFIAGSTASPSAQFTYRIERRTEGKDVDWVTVDEFYFLLSTGSGSAALRLPPNVITTVDAPAAGTTSYRALAWADPFTGIAAQEASVARVRLAAQELAAVSGG